MSLWKWVFFGLCLLAGSVALNLYVGNELALLAEPLKMMDADSGDATKSDRSQEPVDEAVGRRVVGFGHVDVEGGTTPLTVPTIGQVKEVLVQDGDRVVAGQPLIRLNQDAAQAMVDQAEAVVQEAKLQWQAAKKAPQRLIMKRRLQEQAIQAAKARVAALKSELSRLEELVKTSVLPNEKYTAAKEQLPVAEAAVRAEELRLEEIGLEDPEELIAQAKAALATATAQRDVALRAMGRHTLTAPQDGLVLRVLVSKGQVLGAQQKSPAIWFCPDKPLIVRCEIDQEFAHRVRQGLRAEVSADHLKSQPYPGRVSRCADWIAHRRSLLDEPFQQNDVRTLECIIILDDPAVGLRIGQRMRVEIFDDPSETSSDPNSIEEKADGPSITKDKASSVIGNQIGKTSSL